MINNIVNEQNKTIKYMFLVGAVLFVMALGLLIPITYIICNSI